MSSLHLKFLAIILAVTFVSMSPALKSDFVSNDDNLHVYDNPAIRALDGAHIKQIFTKLFNPTYVPLTALSFAVEYHFVKDQPFLYHLDNLLLHLAVTALVFYFARQIGLPLMAAFVAGLLFGIHPMHVESVAWVTERKDVLYSLFYMLALCSYWKYLKHRRVRFYIATLIFGLLSILSKSMALSLPLVMLICDWYYRRNFDKGMILDKIPHFFYIIPIAMVTYLANARNPIQDGAEAILLWVWCSVFYFWKFLFPVDLVIFYRFPQPFSLLTPEFALSFALLFLLLLAMGIFHKHKLFIFAMLFYFFSIFFLFRFDDIQYLPPVSNRFFYLPSIGFCFLIGLGVERLYKKFANFGREATLMLSSGLIVIAVVLAAMTFVQTGTWKNSITHWSHELQYDPDNAMALVNRGEAYKDIQKYDLAFEDFNRAIAANPNFAEGYNSRGQMYGQSGRGDLALADFLKVIELKPHYDEAYNNIGIVYAMNNDMERAVMSFQKALELDPSNTQAHYNLGEYYYLQGHFDKAFPHFQRIIEINPRSALAYNKRGLLFGIKGQFDLALADFNQSLAIDPNRSEVYKNRGIVFEQKKMFKEAVENYHAAIKINPNNADAYYGRGNVYATMGLYQSAQNDFKKALAVEPRHQGAQQGLGAIHKILSQKSSRSENPPELK